mmetsp:Transcript_10603/g.16188  ORF Transcript_10603/g.16188 Transcript_10603/m.16188 type:complete len:463 (-) Transcript_10603:26-1414(-)|eukprot:CAMPEP_0118686842 /NCGR_PEP_ID=MMETSP0800-20121206/8043_1 /TAXON_ID=210618 ORGANISM="Striatella unipunctata, Strain CCMP2910" /NCGR_SAMPLE_ID=MMETSP0800 /ASSEMBLY_ACC=CAM_ASM_000638 /LENGTH=462 /DNA_ID=CAMNT_0006583943 /DNA_START=214 /DNA_END=1602 /DNA_ORIENTATION=+
MKLSRTLLLFFTTLAVTEAGFNPRGGVVAHKKHRRPAVVVKNVVVKQEQQQQKSDKLRPTDTAAGADTNHSDVLKEILSGTTVALASIPSSIAFANIAGVDPLIGVWSSVVLGTVASLTGMRPGLVAGSAGVVVVPLSKVIVDGSTKYMGATVLTAAILEMAFGVFRGGKLIDLVSSPVMSGFLNGLGCLLLQSQFKVFKNAAQQAWLPQNVLLPTLAVAAVTSALSVVLPLVLSGWPTALLAIVGASLFAKLLGLPVECLSIAKNAKWTDALPRFAGIPKLTGIDGSFWTSAIAPAAFSIAVISVMETLLAVKVVDDYDQGKETMDKDKTCRALAFGNFASCFMGGFGGSGLIPNTLLNLQSGGRGKISVIAYAAVMAVGMVFFGDLLNLVPVASLAGIMILVALRTIQWQPTLDAVKDFKENKVKLVALATASVLCYKVDMGSGIIAGVLIEKLLPKLLK